MKTTRAIIIIITLILAAIYWVNFRPGVLKVNVTPASAIIKIEDEELPQIKKGEYTLRPGWYNVTISTDDYVPWSNLVHISSSRVRRVNAILKKKPAPTQITDAPVRSPYISDDSAWLYYLSEDGSTAMRQSLFTNESGMYKSEDINQNKLAGALSANWNGDLAILSYTDHQSLYGFERFKYITQSEKVFPAEQSQTQFSPMKDMVSYVLITPAESTLAVMDANFLSVRKLSIEHLQLPIRTFWSSSEEKILILDGRGEAFVADVFSGQISPLRLNSGEYADNALAAPSGNIFALEINTSIGPTIKILDADTLILAQNSITGYTAKSAWKNASSLIVAAKKEGESDTLLEWDSQTGVMTPLFYKSSAPLHIFNPFLTIDGIYYFQDEAGFLYKLALVDNKY